MSYYETYHRARVLAVRVLGPHLVRVRFGGPGLVDFRSSGVPDERLMIVLPHPGEASPPAPVEVAPGRFDYPDEATRPPMRSYTVSSVDPGRGELDIDLVTHGAGVAGTWASGVQPGAEIYLTTATGWFSPPADTAWLLLAADLTGLPALGRILRGLAPGVRAYAFVEVPEVADRQPLPSPAALQVTWLTGGNGVTPGGLVEAVQRFVRPEGPGYVWFAGEAADSRAVRRHVRGTLGWPIARYRSLGYWQRDKERWTARYAEVGPELESVYAQAVAAGHSSTEALELYDEALAEAGL